MTDKETPKEYRARYYQENKEWADIRHAEYVKEHKAEIQKYFKRYYKRNKDKFRGYAEKRKAKENLD